MVPTQIPAVPPLMVFFGRSNANQTISIAGAVTPLNLGAHDIDELGGHSTTTQTSRYVVKRAGLYNISGSAFVGSSSTAITSANGYRIAAITKNGAYIPGATGWGVYPLTGTAIHVFVAPVPVICAINDYIEIVMNTGLAGTVMGGDASNGSTLRVDLVR